MKSLKLRRRTFLRGALGVAVGLPVLECMLDGNGNLLEAGKRARAQDSGLPRRYGVVFAGQAIGADGTERNHVRINGTVSQEEGHFIVPGATDANGAFVVDTSGNIQNAAGVQTPLLPLAADGLMGDFSLVSGLRIPFASTAAADGSDVPSGGAFRDFHGGGSSPLLSGAASRTSSFEAQGPTSDQIVAAMNAASTPSFPNGLVLRAQPAFYVSGFDFSGREFISYAGAGGRDNRINAQINPRIAWSSLFSTFVPDDAGAAAIQDFTQRKRISVLDLVTGKRERILAKVGAADRIRLTRHFDELRDLETRIKAIPPPTTGTCQPLADPGDPPAVGGDNNGSGFDPSDPSNQIGQNTGFSGEDVRASVMVDLIHMAFVCDLARAATLQITAFQSHMNVRPLVPTVQALIGRPDLDIRADLHENGHNGDPDNKGQLHVSAMLAWHISFYSKLMRKLKETPEGAGNVLDNTCLVFMPEAGHGTQLNDGTSPFATHSVEDMILLVGGRAGGLVPGRHLPTSGAHPGQVLLAAMQSVGFTGNTFGDVSGPFSGLFG